MIDTVEPPNDEYQGTNDSHLLLGHPPELSDSVKPLLTDAKTHGFEVNQVLKSIDI